MRRIAACAVLAFALVTLQLMGVDRLRLPGGGLPDVALLGVVAAGLTRGRATGMLAGFCTGLGLDLAPPASHAIGLSAFVFCLVGYGSGQLAEWLNRSITRLLAAGLAGALVGEALLAAGGLLTGGPRVTLAAIGAVLPTAVLYDVLLGPVVFLLATMATRLRAPAPGGGSAAQPSRPRTPVLVGGPTGSRGRAGARRPRLRRAGAGRRPSAGLPSSRPVSLRLGRKSRRAGAGGLR